MSPQAGGRSHIANYILAGAAVVFLFTYPLQDIWLCALLSHLSGAAFIGGLADWYAVTALFRKPLGISFKTALIPRSKERIAEMARHMVESEILTVPNMYKVLKSHPVLDAGLDYLHSEKGFQSAEQILGQMLNTFLYTVDIKTIVRASSDLGEKAWGNIRIAPILARAIKVGMVGESGNNFLDFAIYTAEKMVRSDAVKSYMADIYLESLRQYEKRNFVYALIVKAALSSELLGPGRVSATLQVKILDMLAEAKQPGSENRKKAMQFIWQQAERLETNRTWQDQFEKYKLQLHRYASSRPDLMATWQHFIQNPERQRRVCHAGASYLVGKLEAWQQSDARVEQLNRTVLALVARELKRLQAWFGKTAERELLQYDSQVLAQQIESKVWYDLQMIRVNGSLVGALLGTLIFLAMYGVKGGW